MASAGDRSSLARMSGVGASVAVSALIVAAHSLFALAQLNGQDLDCPGFNSTTGCGEDFPVGGLGEISLFAHVALEARGMIAVLLGIAQRIGCSTACPHPDAFRAADAPRGFGGADSGVCDLLTCAWCADVAGLQAEETCALDVKDTLLHMSYFYSIDHLWLQDASPICQLGTEPECTGRYPGRVAAGVLFAASFVWPHVKLLLLHIAYYARLRPAFRRNLNYWLAFFGKWTLIDVLVMCTLIALVDLHDALSLELLWQRVTPDFDHACVAACEGRNNTLAAPLPPGSALALADAAHIGCNATCAGIARAVDAALDADLAGSSLSVAFRMRGLLCMYAFCIAVVISLSTSVLVEYLDDDARAKDERRGASPSAGPRAIRSASPGPSAGPAARLLVAADDGPLKPPMQMPCAASAPTALSRGGVGRWYVLLSVAQLCATVSAIVAPLFKREMPGSLPALLRDHHFDFEGRWSLLEIAALSGQAGGWDSLMSATFWAFTVVCPVLRSTSLLALLVLPMPLAAARRLARISRYLSYYYALEVILVVVPVMHMAMAPLTSNLITRVQFPMCVEINKAYPNPPGTFPEDLCFSIDILPAYGYWLALASVLLSALASFDGSPAHKYVHRHLHPADEPPPTWAGCCADCCARCRCGRASAGTTAPLQRVAPDGPDDDASWSA